MIIRTARSTELPALTTYAGEDDRNASRADYLTSLLDKKCTHPEWAYVAEDADGNLIGNIVLWTRPGGEKPTDFVLFDAPWDDTTVARALLDHAFAEAAKMGADHLAHVVDSPAEAPQYQVEPEKRWALLADYGFDLTRDGNRFRWQTGTPVPEDDPRVTWKSIVELGEAPFVDMAERILSDTKDAILRADIAELGLRGAAELLISDMKEMEHEPEWFELGFDDSGEAVALSLPAKNPGFPVIGFVGVAPAGRGKGYSTAIVIRGTRILVANGATDIRGDCDAGNVGMYKGFARAGYDNFADRKAFSRAI
ncbi:hypothetical protein Afil01_68760 [Actinorhabdospora filicis]|uniref:N-acetyltransferase domain-containing protein n=1 Tax=Actinorhabdospora filicis TaxID=1785913 RepID=A0A9W6WCX5_9ACTN|nr:mycothiol acetyltransferase [Actinorhabdospora filicis]GLZ82069.1 hypothetical protein Afil01_68760 [Actinorhabdospora filicis]